MIYLKEMTEEMYHSFFKDYQNDPALFADGYHEFVYSKEWVDNYVQKCNKQKRISLAIMDDQDIVGEILFKNIKDHHATLSIVLKNDSYKNRGVGTKAEQLAIQYAFDHLQINMIYADTIKKNTRSKHVLEKVGFQKYKEDHDYDYYQYIQKD